MVVCHGHTVRLKYFKKIFRPRMALISSFRLSLCRTNIRQFSVFTRECNETSIAGGEKALTHSLTRFCKLYTSYMVIIMYPKPHSWRWPMEYIPFSWLMPPRKRCTPHGSTPFTRIEWSKKISNLSEVWILEKKKKKKRKADAGTRTLVRQIRRPVA